MNEPLVKLYLNKSKNRWYVNVYWPSTRQRKRISLGLNGNEDPKGPYAEYIEYGLPALIAEAEAQDTPQPAPEPGNPTLASLCEWYVSTIMQARGNRDVVRSENRRIYKGMCAWFAARAVVDVDGLAENPGLLDSWTAERLRAAKSGTVRKELAKLKGVFSAAYKRGLITVLPVKEWPMPRPEEPEFEEPLTPEEFALLFNRLRERSDIYNIVRFIAYVGCRPIDACSLTRDRLIDIDGPEPRALIRQQKTGKLVSIALSPPAVAAISDECKRPIHSACIFTNRRGDKWRPDNISKMLKRHSAKIGIRKVTAKSFRQTLVSVLFDDGADATLIQKITGHRSDAIEKYRLLRRGAAHEAAARFAELMDVETTENPG